MDTTPQLPGKFVWFEHVSNDVAAARAFYEPLFGWHAEAMPGLGPDHFMLMCGAGGIGGMRRARAGEACHWMSYLSVTDLDASLHAAVAAGATVRTPPTEYPPFGRGAGLADPAGAAFSLWASASGDPPDGDVPPGGFVWNELSAPDTDAALAFYERAFGLGHATMDMGENGPYHILQSADGKGRAGVYRSSQPGTPSMWLPYVHVADCDASVAQARQLGAQRLLFEPMDVPGVGRIAALLDPQGAAIAMIKPVPM